jgi:hypothetical protein
MGNGAENVPKLLHAHAPQDMAEEQNVCRLANSHHAVSSWIFQRKTKSVWDRRLLTLRFSHKWGRW